MDRNNNNNLLKMVDINRLSAKSGSDTKKKLQTASYSKMYKKQKLKKAKQPNLEVTYLEELGDKEKEIRLAIEMRFQKSRMNQEYTYNDQNDKYSSHSSDMEEYEHLKTVHYYNLADQNKNPKKKADDMTLPNQKSTMKRFKINNNPNNPLRKTEGDEVSEQKKNNWLITNNKTKECNKNSEKSESPASLLAKYLFKHNKLKENKDKKMNLSTGESSKYETIHSPSIQKNALKNYQVTRYPVKKNLKENLSQESSNSESSGFKSNLTLHLEFKQKQKQKCNPNTKITSSTTRLNTLALSSTKLQTGDNKKCPNPNTNSTNFHAGMFSRKLK